MKQVIPKNYYCWSCERGFTRNGSGKRHNDNLHGGNAKIFTTIEFIIKKLGEELSVKNPAFFKLNALGPKDGIYDKIQQYGKEYPASPERLRMFNEQTSKDNSGERSRNRITNLTGKNKSKTLNPQENQYRFQSCPEQPSCIDIQLERNFIVCEIQVLLKKCCHPSNLPEMLNIAYCLYASENDKLLEEMLRHLRRYDKITSS